MIGTVLCGRYEITGLLADGPIFAAYSARDRVSTREMCVRLVKPPFSREPDFLQRLGLAIGRYAGVRSPNVEVLSQLDDDDGVPFVVGELTRAPSLADRLKKLAPFSIPVSVATAMSVVRALDALHRAGIVHGDLGSHNVAILADGEAKLQMGGVWESYAGSSTAGSVVLPSMAPYLAPEVSQGGHPSPASDLYAVGVLLFELLTGRQPYVGETALATVMKHSTAVTPSVRSINPSVPMVLDEIIKKALAKQPADRYPSASEMLTDLRLLQDALRFGRPITWPLRTEPVAAPIPAKVKAVTSVAPRMSAIRDPDDYDDRRRRRTERDVPVWMMLVIVFLGAVALSLLGVYLLFNFSKPRMYTVPNIRGLATAEARGVTDKMHLRLVVGSTVPNERVEQDHVVDVSPPPGSRIREGGQLTVTLSAGSKLVEVPNLKGMTPDKARSVLSTLHLNLYPPLDTTDDPSVGAGAIARQTPAPQTKVDRDTTVRVTTSTGVAAKPPPDAVPESPRNTYHVVVTLKDLVSATDVRVEMTDDNGTSVLHDEVHQPDDVIDLSPEGQGKKVVFRIFYNDKLVKVQQETAPEAANNR